MPRHFFALVLLLLLAPTLHAQRPAQAPNDPTATPPATPPDAIHIFRAKLPGGSYEVAVRSIISVSTHEYVVDGVARVTEVNIDTAGAMVVRFYFIEPAGPTAPGGVGAGTLEKAQQLLTEGAERSGQDVWKKVVKSYPVTTHARTIEYRLDTKDSLSKILKAAEAALRTQRTQSVTLP